VADLFGLASDPPKYDHHSGGRAEWLAKVHAIELGKITPAKIKEWKHSFLASAGNDSLALRKARILVNTFLRRSRSLFSRKVLRQLQLSLPSPLPFDGVEFEPRQSMKYSSEFYVIGLIRQANRELGTSDPGNFGFTRAGYTGEENCHSIPWRRINRSHTEIGFSLILIRTI
jgi:hypothetical protein